MTHSMCFLLLVTWTKHFVFSQQILQKYAKEVYDQTWMKHTWYWTSTWHFIWYSLSHILYNYDVIHDVRCVMNEISKNDRIVISNLKTSISCGGWTHAMRCLMCIKLYTEGEALFNKLTKVTGWTTTHCANKHDIVKFSKHRVWEKFKSKVHLFFRYRNILKIQCRIDWRKPLC